MEKLSAKILASEKAPNRTCWKEGLEERAECLSCSVQKPTSLNDWCKPRELLFGRKIRTKLPELSDVHVEQEVRDRDNEKKSKSKAYADMQRNERYSEVLPGDQVLVQQERKNKLTTRFGPSPYTVVNKHGNSLIVQSPGGAQYSRNTSHVKELLENGDTHDDRPSIPEVVVTEEPHKQDKLTPQQSVVIPEPNVVEPKVPLRRSQRHRVSVCQVISKTIVLKL